MLKSAFSRKIQVALMGLALLVTAFAFMPAAFCQGVDRPDPDLKIVSWRNGDIVEGEVLVQFKQGADATMRTDLHRALGAERIESLEGGLERLQFKGRTIDEMIEAYSKDPSVEFAEPNIIHYSTKATPNDAMFLSQWGPKKIECESAWEIHKGDPDDLCAVIDSGLDMNHEDFDGQYAGGYDYYSGDSNPDDTYGHGTHVCGTVGAKTNNYIGVAGVAWNCRLLVYRAGNYTLPTTAIVNSINAARSAGALAISMSFGSGQQSSSITSALTTANNAGVVCVAAAGNEGNTAYHWPAAAAPVIAVASSNQNDGRSGFSTYGSWVEVAAPGESILSTYDGNTYAWSQGTSMACPHVSGMAVILYSLLGGVRSKANADIVRAAIEDSCVPLSWVKFGRVDLNLAMNIISPPVQPSLYSVSPQQVQAFSGGNLTLTGANFQSITKVTVDGYEITGLDITVVSTTEIKVPAPTAPGGLGQVQVTVTNPGGTSNPGTFNYIETDPPKLTAPYTTYTGQPYSWEFGAGASDRFLLVLSTSSNTINYQGFPILKTRIPVLVSSLSAAGVGGLTVTVPSGGAGSLFYSQVITFDEGGSHGFTGATNITTSIIVF